MLGKAPLTQYLGFQEENMALEPSIVEIGYQTGSSYLVCSDGVTDMLSDEEIREILGKNSTAEEKVEELLEMALAKGGRDNVTMVLAQISGYEERNPLKRWAERHSTGRPSSSTIGSERALPFSSMNTDIRRTGKLLAR